MSLVPYRVEILKYSSDNNLHFIKYGSKIRDFLIVKDIMYVSENYSFEFELDIEKLKDLVQNRYWVAGLDKEFKKEIKDNDMVGAFKKEIEYADRYKKSALIYHIF